MKLVVDTSVAMKWLIDEPGSEIALNLQGHDLVAPALLRIEAANVFRMLAAKNAVEADAAEELFNLLQQAPMNIIDADDGLEERALDLALELGHPVYDCIYLAVAERMNRFLITADIQFIESICLTKHAHRVISLHELSTEAFE
ncbi:type II toxin-antitoxin system VapC family toxin [Roseovarius pacificus]|uniref:type II toxin-antitoxin system VapC family toxin n=1 Tax=Roseovarius pacificus TaxID=337701 RepID=UPI001992BE5D|nr:type II toxin-antitoxin system VapC family toxin [Roseovarius pacificus]GGO61530.1 hypothetical protein GCM10011315_38440 [Roseovarius pacificus]